MRAPSKASKAAALMTIIPMSYLALARKWRPRSFSELVGQDHITKALIKSLNQDRLHHAYLFTGTRGVGKTSIARLVAKAINCEQGVSATPCLQCDTCVSIEQGRYIDLIEIDGASKTRVEDTRELMDNVPYAATSGRYKVYLIDEVHMLSQHSFNALLKTLEEPPPHVKFLFATTDPQKLPATILSRCLQFSLKRLSVDAISKQIRHILTQEQLPFEEESLPLLAKAADGSMRDALSLLDQCLAGSTAGLTAKEVREALGYTQQDYALALLQALSAKDAPQLLALSRQIYTEGGQFSYVLDEMQSHLHQLAIHHTMQNSAALLETSEDIVALANSLSPEEVQLFYQIALKGSEDMQLAPSLSIGFEMTLLRMLAFKPLEPLPPPKSDKPKESMPVVIEPQDKPQEAAIAWSELLTKLSLTGLAQNAAENAMMSQKQEGRFILSIDKGHQSLFTPSVVQRIEKALSQYYQETMTISLSIDDKAKVTPAVQKTQKQQERQQEAVMSLEQDPALSQLKEDFSAQVVKDSVEPLPMPL